mgnify:CR=1 FL=1
MMTVHSAKGVEWDTVFIPGVTRFDWPRGICVFRQEGLSKKSIGN